MTAAGIRHPPTTRSRRQPARDRRSPPPTPRLHVEAQWPEVRRPWLPANRTRPRPAPRPQPARPLNPEAQVRPPDHGGPSLRSATLGMPPPTPRPPPARPLDPTVPSFVPSFRYPHEFGFAGRPDTGDPSPTNPMGPDTAWDLVGPGSFSRLRDPRRERDERMWAQFQFEMLRVQTGMARRLSRHVSLWIDEVVEKWIVRRHKGWRLRPRTWA